MAGQGLDRKSTRLNSSHLGISYAVFCLKKKKRTLIAPTIIRLRPISSTPSQRTARWQPRARALLSGRERGVCRRGCFVFCFFFNDTATTEIYTLSLHDALPISCIRCDSTEVYLGEDGTPVCAKCGARLKLELTEVAPG